MEHVNSLVQSIKANGGLIDPVIVRDNDFRSEERRVGKQCR